MLARKTRLLLASTAVAAVALFSQGMAYADDLQAVQASNVLRVAMSGQYSPLALPMKRMKLSVSTPPSEKHLPSAWA